MESSLQDLFAGYELLEQIGRGGMGVVFRARDRRLDRLVALKMIHGSSSASVSSLARFQIEAQTCAKLDHPNIVSTYEVGEFEGSPFFTMRLVQGSHLGKQLSRWAVGSAPRNPNRGNSTSLREVQTRVAKLVATLARAVSHAHEKGVVHRDLKPSNILIDAEDQPHLTDFGIAKLLSEQPGLTATTDILGTPAYMSPEQASSGVVGPASDIYSLGAVLYELLTGRPPFRAPTPIETLRQVTSEEPVHPTTCNRHIDADLATICLKCLEKNPLHRYASARLLAEDLEHWMRREPILARRASPATRVKRWTQRNPVGAALIVALFLGFGTALLLLDRVNQEKNKQVLLVEQIRQTRDENSALVASNIERLRARLESLWEERGKRFFIIPSEDLAMLGRRPSSPAIKGKPLLRYKVGIGLQQSPVSDSEYFSFLLAQLEEQLTARLDQTVRLDLHFFKFVEDKNNAIAEGKIDITLIGAFRYLTLQAQNRRLQPLVVPKNASRFAVFFTRPGSPIHSLQDLRGHSMAFGDTNSTTSFCAQIKLAQAGLTSGACKTYDFLDSTLEFIEDVKTRGPDEAIKRIGYLNSHAQVIEGVASGRYDLGVAQVKAFELNYKLGLVAVGKPFEVSRRLWVAREDLEQPVGEAFIQTMIGFGEQPWLQALEDRPSSYIRINPEMFKEERDWLSRIEVLLPQKPPPPRIPIPGTSP